MKIAIIGRHEILYKTAELLAQTDHHVACIITANAAPEYTKSSADFENLAKEMNIPFFHTAQISEAGSLLQQVKADVGVSMNYPGIIPARIIDIFPLGILNAHGGDLPKYRGNACQAWAIINGEEKIGLCVHKMVGGELDSGPIIARRYKQIDLGTKITDVFAWMFEEIPALFLEALNLMGQDKSFVLEYQSDKASDQLRCYPRGPEDARIDWKCSAEEIIRLINASNKPFAGAYTFFNDKKLIVWDAGLSINQENFCAVPGQVTTIKDDYIEVACGKDKIKITAIEYESHTGTPTLTIKSLRSRLK